MSLVPSKNFERYKEWYIKGSLTDEQLDKLHETGLLSESEVKEIKKIKFEKN